MNNVVSLLMDTGHDLHIEGDLQAAFVCYSEALSIDPLNPILLANISQLLQEAGCPDAAEQVHNRALQVRN
jgi:tetratricopeptide (TPR) repeat protein